MIRHSRKVIENTIRLWESMLLAEGEPVYDELFEKMMDVSTEMHGLPNWMRTPEFVAELRGFVQHERPAADEDMSGYFRKRLRKAMDGRSVLTYDIDVYIKVDYPRPASSYRIGLGPDCAEWPTFREMSLGRGRGLLGVLPLYYNRFVFVERLDERFAGRYRGRGKYGSKSDCLFEMSSPNSADAAKVCLPGTNEIMAIDENGVIG